MKKTSRKDRPNSLTPFPKDHWLCLTLLRKICDDEPKADDTLDRKPVTIIHLDLSFGQYIIDKFLLTKCNIQIEHTNWLATIINVFNVFNSLNSFDFVRKTYLISQSFRCHKRTSAQKFCFISNTIQLRLFFKFVSILKSIKALLFIESHFDCQQRNERLSSFEYIYEHKW